MHVVRRLASRGCAQVQKPGLHLHHRCGCRGGRNIPMEGPAERCETWDSKLATEKSSKIRFCANFKSVVRFKNGWSASMAHGQAVVLFFFAVLLHSRLALMGRGYGTAQGVPNQTGVPTAAACHGFSFAKLRFEEDQTNAYKCQVCGVCVFHHGAFFFIPRTT